MAMTENSEDGARELIYAAIFAANTKDPKHPTRDEMKVIKQQLIEWETEYAKAKAARAKAASA